MSLYRSFTLVFLLFTVFFCRVVWALPFQNKADIQLASVEVKYNAQRQILILQGELSVPILWHVYAHDLEQEYYVETGFRLQDPSKGELVRSKFPKEENLTVAGDNLKVHSGNFSFTQWFYLNPKSSQTQGENKSLFPIEMRFQYQACSDKICLPPVLFPVVIREEKGNKLLAEWQ